VAGGVLAAALYFFQREPPREDRRAEGARLMSELMSGKAPVGGPFTLAGVEGKPVALEDFRGKIVLLP